MSEWATTVSAAALLEALIAGGGDYRDALAALEPPLWRVKSVGGWDPVSYAVHRAWEPGECAIEKRWPQETVRKLAQALEVKAEVAELRRSHRKTRRR